MDDLIDHLQGAGLDPIVIDENTQFPTLSPFLPNTKIQFAWDSTSIGYIKRCPRLYQYTMIDGWQPKGEVIHLRFGIEYHEALHDYEKCKAQGQDHDEALHHTVRALLERTWTWDKVEPRTDSEKLKTRPHLVRSVIWYLDKYKDDPAETVILSGDKPACELSFRFELDYGPTKPEKVWDPRTKQEVGNIDAGQPYVLSGHLDRVVTFQDHLFICDRKTTSITPGSYYFDQYSPENQMSLYTLAGGVVLGTKIKGVIIDAIQIAVNFSRPVRGMTYRTPDQLDEWVKDLRYWLEQAERYATDEYWPMNDTSCDKYGGCRFRKICSKSPSVRENFLKSDFIKGEPWNPLKTR